MISCRFLGVSPNDFSHAGGSQSEDEAVYVEETIPSERIVSLSLTGFEARACSHHTGIGGGQSWELGGGVERGPPSPARGEGRSGVAV